MTSFRFSLEFFKEELHMGYEKMMIPCLFIKDMGVVPLELPIPVLFGFYI